MENQGYEEETTREAASSTSRGIPREENHFPQGNTRCSAVNARNGDGHIYEDIESWQAERSYSDSKLVEPSQQFYDGPRDVRVDRTEKKQANSQDRKRINGNFCQHEVSSTENGDSTVFSQVPYTQQQQQQKCLVVPRNSESFHRNLTLPFRRATDSTNANYIASSSVRVTNAERNEREKNQCFSIDLIGREPTSNSQRDKQERNGKRRRKKDCKHCRSKMNGESGTRNKNDDDNSQGFSVQEREKGLFIADDRHRRSNNTELIGLNLLDGTSMLLPREKSAAARGSCRGKECHAPDNKPAIFTVESYDGNRCEENDRKHSCQENKAFDGQEKNRNGMRVNSIYSQGHWYAKENAIFSNNVKQDTAFQRAFSLPSRTQTVSSQNRVNLRRSVRGEPPPHPAQLQKHRHGWTLHFARPLDSTGCTRSIVLLFIAILALLGVGAAALYVVFEPEKLLVIRQYLKSSAVNSTADGSSDVPFAFTSSNEPKTNETLSLSSTATSLLSEHFNDTLGTTKEDENATTSTENYTSTENSTRYCDDCLEGEVCVALVDEDVPICRVGLDSEDPTGCAGLCLINKQRCHRLDVDAFRCVEVEHYCLDDEWTCSNTLCIPLEKRCDGHMNCYDHSDEYNCVCDEETHFQCGNETSCLPLDRKCDGKIDCWDAADEINCTLACPLENEFTCSSGQCILKARFCDGLADCNDGSDEPQGCQGRCNKHEFTCRNGRCITKGMKCNGVDDCGDGTDEQHCKDRFAK